MSSEWMKVMLEEIARKKAQEAEVREEFERRDESKRRGETQDTANSDRPLDDSASGA